MDGEAYYNFYKDIKNEKYASECNVFFHTYVAVRWSLDNMAPMNAL